MNDSELGKAVAARREERREARVRQIKRWVAYIKSNPPDVWGPQQNALVNSQLESARASGLDAEHYWQVRAAGRDWRDDHD